MSNKTKARMVDIAIDVLNGKSYREVGQIHRLSHQRVRDLFVKYMRLAKNPKRYIQDVPEGFYEDRSSLYSVDWARKHADYWLRYADIFRKEIADGTLNQ